MGARGEVPEGLGAAFAVAEATAAGVSRRRLRADDLPAPFHGVRLRSPAVESATDVDPWEAQRRRRVARASEYAPRMHPQHFFSHETAASLWGAPLPFARDGSDSDVHVGVAGPRALPRARGVVHHRIAPTAAILRRKDGLQLTSPAATWASLGALAVPDLVALGDYLCRVWRSGVGRSVGAAPLATVAELDAAIAAGRRVGAPRLRAALRLVRLDAWSPRESQMRVEMVEAGLAEPELNVDVFDERGRFLGCLDLAYPHQRVGVEYFGMLHRATWAADVERLAGLRAAGWIIIEVTAPLLRHPEELVRRVAQALASRR